MANGFCPSILSHIGAVIGMNEKNKQLYPAGFLRMLLATYDSANVLNAQYAGGHKKETKLSYKKRPTSAAVRDTAPDCDFFNQSSKLEYTIPNLNTKSTGFFLDDALIRQYCKDASDYIKLDKQANKYIMERETLVMREVYDDMLNHIGILWREVNKALVTDMSTSFGTNVKTGTNSVVAYDFDIRSTAINDGIIKLFNDLRENEIIDNIKIVGSGDFMNLEIIKAVFNNNTDQGLSRADFMRMLPEMFFDLDTKTIWGDNQIGVFTNNSVQLIARNFNQMGFERKLGNSTFFGMPIPVGDFGAATGAEDKMVLDVQIKEFDCATTITEGYETREVGPGVQVSLSYNFALFVTPDIFDEADHLSGTNGTLRYEMNGIGPCPCPE